MRSLALLIAFAACGDSDAPRRATESRLPVAAPPTAAPSTFTVGGTVVDRDTGKSVGTVEVVLRGEHGDVSATTAASGAWAVSVPPGAYRVFIRDDEYMSTGMQGRIRLRSLPRPELAGAPDELLMPVLDVTSDIAGIELPVTTGATYRGKVVDPDGNPVGGVTVAAFASELSALRQGTSGRSLMRRTSERPVLGTDSAISKPDGTFTLRVVGGDYILVANHPRYAGFATPLEIGLPTGLADEGTASLARGCIITGKVVAPNGTRVHDGAIETQRMQDVSFGPAGRIEADGTFRWATIEGSFIALRAWPWRQPAAAPRTFECGDGKRYDDVVLTLPTSEPDIAGTIVDARGNPVPMAYLDVASLSRGLDGQQERADAAGRFSVFDVPAGRYQLTASAPGRGVITETATAPRHDVTLQLSGTGRIAGTTSDLVDGSFELVFHHCGSASDPIELADDARIVVVRGGQFSVDRVPACSLTMAARWRGMLVPVSVVVEPDRTAYVDIALGPPRPKQVHGVVRDAAGKPVPDARVTAIVDSMEATTVRTDANGEFAIATQAGAQLVAGTSERIGRATVGRANIATERLDISLTDDADGY